MGRATAVHPRKPPRAVIVSASHRTDIPAFYRDWFLARLKAGFALAANPYGGKPTRIALDSASVDGFVFWTRNPAPFLPALAQVRARGHPFVVQTTITGYPRFLDRHVPSPEHTLAVLHWISAEFGVDSVVWRYDPVVWTADADAAFHRANFARLAAALQGAANEVVLSWVHPYAKTRRNLAAATGGGPAWRDPADAEKREMLEILAGDAVRHGFQPTVCAQPHLLTPALSPARCVDAGRLSRVAARFGAPPVAAEEHGNRPGCACHRSRDLGAYETCPHGCVYCYAVADTSRAAARVRGHDPAGAFVGVPAAAQTTEAKI